MKQCTVLIWNLEKSRQLFHFSKRERGGLWSCWDSNRHEKKTIKKLHEIHGGGSLSLWMNKNGKIFWVCISRVCYCYHRYSRFGFSRRSPSGFVLLVPSIQFTPATERVSSKFDPLLMKQQLHRVELIIAPQGRQLLYEHCGCLREERQLCCLRSCNVLIFTLNLAGIITRQW